jgi:uncharacterized protein (TIGR02996 family)
MSTTLAALLQGCKDAPDEPEPRQILADWLDDHGDPDRAELIRLQLALHGFWGDEPDAPEQQIRVASLMRHNGECWLGPVARLYSNAQLERGFLTIEGTARQLLDHPPTELLPDVLGWVERLHLDPEREGREELLDSSLLGCFSRLTLRGLGRNQSRKLGDPEVRRLVANPCLEGVHSLDLRSNALTAEGIAALARCDRLAGLRGLAAR